MRCLQTTGFINFRMRAMIVSFACFVLHISWKEINYPLAKLFIDYEPGIHISQLQMQAGIVGINTIRVYSPSKQAIDQDPDAIFIKKWVPELKNFTPAEIHSYNKINLAGYYVPVVDYEKQIKIMKDRIFKIRKSPQTQFKANEIQRKFGSKWKSKKARKKKEKKSISLNLF